MPVRIIITDGTTANCTQASKLISGIAAEYLLADKGYDSDAIVVQAESQGMPLQEKTEKFRENRIKIYTSCGILLRMHFSISSAGAALQAVMQKMPDHSWQQCTFDASLYGLISRDYTI